MAISRMNMERQMRNMGGIMELEEPRQGFFLGKIVKKAKKAVKKIVKSPIGKAAILGAIGLAYQAHSLVVYLVELVLVELHQVSLAKPEA